MENDILNEKDIKGAGLTQDDIDLIDKEMNEEIENTKKEIDEEIDNDEELKKQIDELLGTDDIKERIEIWKKYHPNQDLYI